MQLQVLCSVGSRTLGRRIATNEAPRRLSENKLQSQGKELTGAELMHVMSDG